MNSGKRRLLVECDTVLEELLITMWYAEKKSCQACRWFLLDPPNMACRRGMFATVRDASRSIVEVISEMALVCPDFERTRSMRLFLEHQRRLVGL